MVWGNRCVLEAREKAFPEGGFSFARIAHRIAAGIEQVKIEVCPVRPDANGSKL